jgi:hypothetical protein
MAGWRDGGMAELYDGMMVGWLSKMAWWQDARITGCQDGRMAG